MIALEEPPALTVEEFQKFQDKMFATELMQTLVHRNRVAIRHVIVAEEEMSRPNTARIDALERESRRLDNRRFAAKTTEEIKAVVEEMKTYTVPAFA